MGKLKQITMAVAFLALPFAFALPAAAADCTITNTGPGSNNECQSTADYSCVIDNENNVTITNQSGQTVGTGTANTSGNISGGGSTSGTASNTNGTAFSFQVSNEGCAVTAVSQPEAPKPSSGGGSTEAKTVTPTQLPYTASDYTPIIIASIVAGCLIAVTAFSAVAASRSRL